MKKLVCLSIFTVFMSSVLALSPVLFNSLYKPCEVTRIETVKYTDYVNAKGQIGQYDERVIRTEYPVIVSEILFSKGDVIKSGDKLLSIDKEATAKKIMESNEYASLGIAGIGSSITDYDSISKMIPDFIYSESNGIVSSINIKSSDYIASNGIICTLLGNDNLTVVASVNENYIYDVKIGQPVIITGNAFGDKEYSGVVEEISNSARKQYVGASEETVVDVIVRITNTDDTIKSGYTAKIKICTSSEKMVDIIPYDTVNQDDDGKEFVYVFSNGVAVRKDIGTGAELVDGVEVVYGVGESDNILKADEELSDGDLVKVVE